MRWVCDNPAAGLLKLDRTPPQALSTNNEKS